MISRTLMVMLVILASISVANAQQTSPKQDVGLDGPARIEVRLCNDLDECVWTSTMGPLMTRSITPFFDEIFIMNLEQCYMILDEDGFEIAQLALERYARAAYVDGMRCIPADRFDI